MQSKLLHQANGKRTFALILQKGDEVMRCLQEFAIRERLGGAQITAIGAFGSATLAFFDWETKKYQPIPVKEQVEVASLIGDIAIVRTGNPVCTRMRYLGGATAPLWPAICKRVRSDRRSRSS
jgi:uncharacterized protein